MLQSKKTFVETIGLGILIAMPTTSGGKGSSGKFWGECFSADNFPPFPVAGK
jgi:hypothetical protein